jgi:hypothetical protein
MSFLSAVEGGISDVLGGGGGGILGGVESLLGMGGSGGGGNLFTDILNMIEGGDSNASSGGGKGGDTLGDIAKIAGDVLPLLAFL